MTNIYVVGIGYRPLGTKASEAVCASDIVLTNDRLLEVFMNYVEYDQVKDKIIVHGSVHEMLDYIGVNHRKKKLSLLAAGDPMFFGIGRVIIDTFGKDAVEVMPDLSSIQVAFSKIKESWNDAFFISVHGGPDPSKRRKLEYELNDIPVLLETHEKLAILTDKINNPAEIAKEFLKPSAIIHQPSALKMFVCEKLGYSDEKITEGTPEEISTLSFSYPNVVIIKNTKGTVNK